MQKRLQTSRGTRERILEIQIYLKTEGVASQWIWRYNKKMVGDEFR